MADNTIDNLSIQVTASAEEASRVFDRLASNAGKLKGATSGAADGMRDAADAADDMGTNTQEAGEQSGKAQPKIRGTGDEAKKTGKKAKEGSSGLKVFWESLKRIAFYRAVRFVIRSITDAFKTGITNMYQWSKVMDGTFAKSMDRLATSGLYLKNSLGAMLAPIINTLAPIIDYVVDGLVVIINHINMIFAALSGASTYTAAKKVATTWADAGKTAAGSAKKASDDIKRTILGFDEINKLEKQNSSSGSSGSGTKKNGLDYSTMFEKRPINSTIKEIADVIRSTFAPIFDFLGNNLSTVLKVVGTIGTAFALWKIGAKLIPGLSSTLGILGKIVSVLGTLTTAVITVALVYNFTNKYLETGKYSYLVGDAISTALGSSISGLIMSKGFGASAGLYTASAVIAVSGLVNVILGINDIDSNGLRKENVMTLLSAGIKGAIAGGLIAKAAGFSIVGGVLTGALVMGVTIGLVATLKLIKFKPEIELTEQQQSILSEIEAGNFDNAMKLSDNNPKTYNDVVAAASGGRTKSKSLWNKIEEIMGWVAYAEDDKSILPDVNVSKSKYTSNVLPQYTLPFNDQWLKNNTAKNKIKEFATAIVTNTTKIKTAMFDATKKATDAVHDFVDKYGQLRDNALGITWERVGTNATTTLKNGMGQTWYQATATVNQGMTDMYNAGMSKSFKPVGSKTVTDIDTGVRSGQPSVNSTMTNTMNGMYNTANQKSFTPVGSKAPREIGNGINSNSCSATNAIWDLMANVQNTADGFSFSGVGSNIAVDIYNGFVQNIGWVANSISNAINNMSNWISNSIRGISNFFNSSTKVTTSTVKRSTATKPTKSTRYNALGGIYANGIWSNIPQYASGTLNAGSLFWAGERGPELVGRAGGRTEVLNKSQLASAMYSAVQAAMAPASANFAAAANYLKSDSNGLDMEMLAEMIQRGIETAMERQRDIQRQQLDTLRQINAKEFRTEITTASINDAQRRQNQRAGIAVAPVAG